jgi:hypothetical protein
VLFQRVCQKWDRVTVPPSFQNRLRSVSMLAGVDLVTLRSPPAARSLCHTGAFALQATALRALALGMSIDHQHGPVSVAQHLLGDAPDQGMLQPGQALGTQEDGIGPTSSTLCEAPLQLIPFEDGYDASGVLCTLEPTPRSKSQNTNKELRFQALLSKHESEVSLTLAQSEEAHGEGIRVVHYK